ncbi:MULTISPECIES: LPXTG cell wall anchor domain-containing protein [unclassified Microbacterium]|uniref:LPXTG cell wall anchor domain-containing protein n=1 Tax=unclassified Microbacterium TaxID=2609290 RepID=UPI0030162C05
MSGREHRGGRRDAYGRVSNWTVRSALAATLGLILALSGTAAQAFTVTPEQGPTAGGTSTTLDAGGLLFPAISAGSQHNLYLDGSGHVWAAGRNLSGELGNGSTTTSRTLVPATIPSDVRITAVAAMRSSPGSSFALDADGRVWAWGSNNAGQLGVAAGADRLAPAMVAGIPALTSISAGAGSVLGLAADGTVWSWGSNATGQNGHAGTTPAAVVGLPAGITAISSGGGFSLALAADGIVWAWGNNTSAELGRGNSGGFSQTPQAVTGLPTIASISAGGSFSLVQATDGRIFGWGGNTLGQLANGTTASPVTTAQQLANVPTGSAVVAGGISGYAILPDGTTRAWGGDLSGQLGNNSTTTATTPITPQLPAGVTVRAVYGGANSTLWVLSDGRYAYAGDNNLGQFGIGASASYIFVPVLAATAVTGVTFGGTPATAIARSGIDITATTPAHPSGLVDVAVTWAYAGTAIPVVQPTAFTFGAPPTISGTAGNHDAGENVAYTYAVTGDELPSVTVTAGSLPPGLTLSAGGMLTGEPTAAGTYAFTLNATNGLGSVTLDDIITVTALTIVTDPADQVVFEGQTASFSAAAESLLETDVRWQRLGDDGVTWNDIPGADEPTYTMPVTTLDDDGAQFRAVFTNTAGSAATAAAALTVVPALTVLTNPVDQTVNAGDPATFTVAAESPLTPLTVQWQSSRDGGATWTDIPFATSPTYVVTAARTVDDGTRFRAVFTVPGATRATEAALLTVITVVPPTPPPAPDGAGGLAQTGGGSGALALAGLGLLIAGALVVVRRHRRSTGRP